MRVHAVIAHVRKWATADPLRRACPLSPPSDCVVALRPLSCDAPPLLPRGGALTAEVTVPGTAGRCRTLCVHSALLSCKDRRTASFRIQRQCRGLREAAP